MKTSATSQGDLFAVPAFDTLPALLNQNGRPSFFIIGCGRTKKRSAAQARELYTSTRFRTSRRVAEALSASYVILSALHGLIDPNVELEPYDLDLGTVSEELKHVWAMSALDDLEKRIGKQPITLIATEAYAAPIMSCNAVRSEPLSIRAPLSRVEDRFHQDWLNQALATAVRVRDLRRLYEIIGRARKSGQTFRLEDLGKRKISARGVYIFLDPAETSFLDDAPRIVRIGTHAVSAGSQSTLKTRLRNHLGQSNGAGSHRGSIFRLHVGRAMLEAKDGAQSLPSWGIGQDAPADIRAGEDMHERRVSEYLRSLEIFIVPIDDEPSKDSLRAHVESQLIALCSEGLQPIDRPSSQWLGAKSPMTSIVRSGLWNLRGVGRHYDPKASGSVESIASIVDAYTNV